MKLVTASDIKPGDYIINLGKVHRVEKFDTGNTGPYCNFTVYDGLVLTCAFYWIKATTKLWLHDEQPPVENSTPTIKPPEKS